MYCPSCESEYRPGYTECADCNVPLVEQLPDNVPRRRVVSKFFTIPKLPDNRPLLLKAVPYLAFLQGSAFILALVFLSTGTFTIDGRVVSSREALSQAGLPLGVLALVSFAVFFVFLREAQWSRHFLIGCWFLVAIWQLWLGKDRTELGLGPFTLDLAVPPALVIFAFSCWYLYAKPSVRAYYRNLKADRGVGEVFE